MMTIVQLGFPTYVSLYNIMSSIYQVCDDGVIGEIVARRVDHSASIRESGVVKYVRFSHSKLYKEMREGLHE